MSSPRLLAALALLSACTEQIVFDSADPWGEEAPWPGIGDGKILVTNSGDDSVSFLDPVTLEPVYRAPVGRIPAEREGPHHGAASLDGLHYYIGLSNYVPGSGSGPHGSHGNGSVDGYLLEYDSTDNRLVAELRVDRSPGDVRITPDGKYVLQSHFDLKAILDAVEAGDDPREAVSTLVVADAETLERVAKIDVCPAAHGIAIAADSSEVYVSCYGSDELAIVSLEEPITDDAVVEHYPVGPGGGDPAAPSYGPYAAMVSPENGEVWVSNIHDDSVVVFDPETRTFDDDRKVRAGGVPFFGDFTADGTVLYVAHQASESLVKIDCESGGFDSFTFPPGSCRAPHAVMLLEDGAVAAVACEGDHLGPGTVVRLRLDIPGGVAAHEADYEVGVFPDDLIFIPGQSP